MSDKSSAGRAFPDAYYEPLADGVYRATAATMSPWDQTLQHGGPPAALLSTAMEAFEPKEDMRIARMTVDFMGPIPLTDVQVTTRIVRPGRKIELLESAMRVNGKDVVVAR